MTAPAGTVLVVNPRATKAGGAARARAAQVLAREGLLDVIVTRGPGDAAARVRAAVDAGATRVACLGGDGTLAEVAGALADDEAVVIPLPGGGTNVFARAVGWPNRLDQAIAELPDALRAGRTARLRLGWVSAGPNRRLFVMNAGVGVDADTVHWVEGHPGLKRRLRQGAFFIGAVRMGVRSARRPPTLQVAVDGAAPLRAAALLITVGRPYTFLGSRPLDLVPGATFDGTIAWRALTEASVAGITGVMVRTIAGRGPDEHDPLVGGVARESLVVRSDPPAAVQADGEPLGWHPEAVITPGPALHTLLPLHPRDLGGHTTSVT